MKKVISIICALAMMMTMSITAFAASEDYSANRQKVINALSGSFRVGDYLYSIPSATIQNANDYFNQAKHQITDVQANTIVGAINNVESIVRTRISTTGDPDLKNLAVSDQKSINTLMTNAAPDGQIFYKLDSDIVILDKDAVHSSWAIPVLVKTYNPQHSSSSGSTPSSGGTGSIDTSTNPSGGTIVTVTPSADSTPVVSGGTSSIEVSAPDSAVNAALASASAQQPAEVKISAPTTAIVNELNSSAVTSVQMSVNLPSIIANNVNPNVNVSLNLDQSVLESAKQTQKDITVTVVDSSTQSAAYSWTFSGKELAQAGASPSTVNIALSVQNSTADANVSAAIPAGDKGLILNFANHGTLPAPATIKVNVANQGYSSGQILYLYYYNSDTKQLEVVNNTSYKVDANGYVTFIIDHCSQYVLLPQQVTAAIPTKSDTGKYLSIQAGKTYQFKITASKQPTFVSGSSSVFKVIANGSKGNDYFFKVTAVGKVGQGAGFYINGEKSPRTIGTIAPVSVKLDTGKQLNVKVGKTYQFKITSSVKPTFACGTKSAFNVVASGSKGNDYFFKVTAVGKAGQGAGFYVNGEKAPRTIGTIIQ